MDSNPNFSFDFKMLGVAKITRSTVIEFELQELVLAYLDIKLINRYQGILWANYYQLIKIPLSRPVNFLLELFRFLFPPEEF